MVQTDKSPWSSNFGTNEVGNLALILNHTNIIRTTSQYTIERRALPVRKIINNTRGNGKAEKDPKSIAVQG